MVSIRQNIVSSFASSFSDVIFNFFGSHYVITLFAVPYLCLQ